MRVLLTGATGFLGRAMVLRLLRDGHELAAAVRSESRAESLLGPDVGLVPVGSDGAVQAALEEADAVLHLAGENVLGGRWTRQRKRALYESRVGLTQRLTDLMARCDEPPSTFLVASAVGYYGSRGDEWLTEASQPGDGFLADLCQRWEAAALEAERLGVRVAVFRIGVVLGPEGGALAYMLPVFKLGLGARLGSGEQYVPWIHERDLAEVLSRALTDSRIAGPIIAAAPNPVTNRDLTEALARHLQRPAPLAVPSWALRFAFGEAKTVLTQSQRAHPATLRTLGHRFEHEHLDDALADILAPLRDVTIDRVPGLAEPMGLRQRSPQYVLTQRTRIDAPISEVFPFFSRPHNLSLLTPAWLGFQILGDKGKETERDQQIEYRIELAGIPMRWRTRIPVWDPPYRFVDEQLGGPYALWHHEHRFEQEGNATFMVDTVHYRLPLGPAGRLAHGLFVRSQLRRIFAYRTEAITLRFGSGTRSVAKGA
jgi:hypothetical protein